MVIVLLVLSIGFNHAYAQAQPKNFLGLDNLILETAPNLQITDKKMTLELSEKYSRLLMSGKNENEVIQAMQAWISHPDNRTRLEKQQARLQRIMKSTAFMEIVAEFEADKNLLHLRFPIWNSSERYLIEVFRCELVNKQGETLTKSIGDVQIPIIRPGTLFHARFDLKLPEKSIDSDGKIAGNLNCTIETSEF